MGRELTLEDIDGRSAGLLAPSRHALDRILAKALAHATERGRRNVEQAGFQKPFRDVAVARDSLSAAIVRAIRTEFPTIGLAPTKRRPMPGTGGMSFHFGHTSVTARSVALKPGQTHWCRNGFGHAKLGRDIYYTSRPEAHQLYIERPSAVEQASVAAEPARAQAYIEDAEKVGGNRDDQVAVTEFSFGTTGETEAERLELWRLAHKYPERANGIIQHRFILQLPKEASAAERLAIVKAFVAPFEMEKVPYWAALHAPTGDNDPRNFHAHVISLNRPAEMIQWPEGGDDGSTDRKLVPTWDFAAVRRIRTKHRNYRNQFPERQDVPDLFRGRFVQRERERFAGLVNAEMERAGKAVRYDHRSYAAAGILDVEPEKKSGYARKITRRDRDLSLHDVAEEIGSGAASSLLAEKAKALGALDRLVTAARSAPDELVGIMRTMTAFSREGLRIDWSRAASSGSRRLAVEVAERRKTAFHLRAGQAAEAATLEATIRATDPEAATRHRNLLEQELKKRSTATRERSASALMELPTAEAAEDLHAAAKEERASRAEVAQKEAEQADRAVRLALDAWVRELELKEVASEKAVTTDMAAPSRPGVSDAEKLRQEAVAVLRKQAAEDATSEARRRQERRKAILSNPGRRGGKGYGD